MLSLELRSEADSQSRSSSSGIIRMPSLYEMSSYSARDVLDIESSWYVKSMKAESKLQKKVKPCGR